MWPFTRIDNRLSRIEGHIAGIKSAALVANHGVAREIYALRDQLQAWTDAQKKATPQNELENLRTIDGKEVQRIVATAVQAYRDSADNYQEQAAHWESEFRKEIDQIAIRDRMLKKLGREMLAATAKLNRYEKLKERLVRMDLSQRTDLQTEWDLQLAQLEIEEKETALVAVEERDDLPL